MPGVEEVRMLLGTEHDVSIVILFHLMMLPDDDTHTCGAVLPLLTVPKAPCTYIYM